jgi:hypothetical protein
MTPKELRAAAETVIGSQDHPSGWGGMICDAKRIARHILATVREDDGEPVTQEMIDQCSSEGNSVAVSRTTVTHFKAMTTTMCVVLLGPTGDWITIEKCKTRGQFRKLCEGLGIVLEEKN